MAPLSYKKWCKRKCSHCKTNITFCMNKILFMFGESFFVALTITHSAVVARIAVHRVGCRRLYAPRNKYQASSTAHALSVITQVALRYVTPFAESWQESRKVVVQSLQSRRACQAARSDPRYIQWSQPHHKSLALILFCSSRWRRNWNVSHLDAKIQGQMLCRSFFSLCFWRRKKKSRAQCLVKTRALGKKENIVHERICRWWS